MRHKTLVLSVHLYNSESWTLNESDEARLHVFKMSATRRICSISLRDRGRNEEVKAWLGIECDVVEVIRKRRLSYFGHTVRIKPERIPVRVIQGRIHGSRLRGRLRKTWIGAVEEDCERRNVSLIQARSTALDHNEWRRVVFGPPKHSLES